MVDNVSFHPVYLRPYWKIHNRQDGGKCPILPLTYVGAGGSRWERIQNQNVDQSYVSFLEMAAHVRPHHR